LPLLALAACPNKDAGDDGGGTVTTATLATVATTTPTTPAPVLSGVQLAPLSFAPIAKQADPSVVTVNVIVSDVVENWAGRKMRREGKGLGTSSSTRTARSSRTTTSWPKAGKRRSRSA
jgi:hypothetical protein